MTADDGDIIGERQKLALDGIKQLPVTAAGKISSSNGACKQHFADYRKVLRIVEIDNAPWRVAGAVQDFESQLANLYPIPLLQPSVGCYVASVHHPE